MHSTSESPTLRKLRGVPETLPALGAEAHESCKGRREKMKCYQGQGTWYTLPLGKAPVLATLSSFSCCFLPVPPAGCPAAAQLENLPPAPPSYTPRGRRTQGTGRALVGKSERVSYLPRGPLKSFTTASPSLRPSRPGSVGVALGAQPICPSHSFGSAFQAVRTFHISFFNRTLFPQTQIPGTLS